jgi:small subunit ribosomal protein S4e
MSKHLKRLNAPRTLVLHRKERKWTVRANPGPHPLNNSLPLALVVRDYLELCDTLRESKRIISNGDIIVDGTIHKDYKFPCGFMDVVSIKNLKKNYRILFDQRGKLTFVPVDDKDSKWKLCRIENKTLVKKNKIQLNFHDGRNKIVDKNDYKTGDVLKINFKDKKIEDIYKFSKGNISIIIGGSHIGETATIEDINIIHSSKPNIAIMKGKTEFSTLKNYVFPIGTKKPSINLPEVKMQ